LFLAGIDGGIRVSIKEGLQEDEREGFLAERSGLVIFQLGRAEADSWRGAL